MTEAPAERRGGFPFGLTLTVAIAFALLVGLGVWQLQRLKWKEAILAHIAALQTAKPQPLSSVLDAVAQGRDADYTRAAVTCPGLSRAPFLELYALQGPQAGARLISACPVESAAYRTILVDRGFLPDTVAERPAVDPADRTPVAITGILRKPARPGWLAPKNRPPLWFVRDVPAMARTLGAPSPAPVMLMAETAANPELKALTPSPLPLDIPNRHLEYALTWFGLAGALLAVYAARLFGRNPG
ncbi:SURF1 family cytochrome oxidase biogenesis protein [Phenylobacterium sp.]|uniref:SURF1 family protein n=1 Tax=Phenylobacterium sp. TaxID=1871053 RepID=UPI002618143C|nr:SURF1 family cytochrome oxidase biogenesis protein [Phenylobacterium sp.]